MAHRHRSGFEAFCARIEAEELFARAKDAHLVVLSELFNDDAQLLKPDYRSRLASKSEEGRRDSFVAAWLGSRSRELSVGEAPSWQADVEAKKALKAAGVKGVGQCVSTYAGGVRAVTVVVNGDAAAAARCREALAGLSLPAPPASCAPAPRATVYVALERARAEELALNRCLATLVGGSSLVAELFLGESLDADGFAELVCERLVPAMAAGFLCERHARALVDAYRIGIARLISASAPEVPRACRLAAMKRLVAGAVYGPRHLLANPDVPAATVVEPASLSMRQAYRYRDASALSLLHVYDEGGCLVGQGASVSGSAASVLIGREDDPAVLYPEKASRLAAEHGVAVPLERAEVLAIPNVDPIHARVSRAHGLLFFDAEEQAWLYCDLDSSNGTILSNESGVYPADGVVRLQPGDSLHLGWRDADADYTAENLYWQGATVLVSSHVDVAKLGSVKEVLEVVS